MKRRARSKTDYEQVQKLAEIQCTDEEIADTLGCLPSAFKRRIRSDKQLREALRKGRALGKMYLRFLQWKAVSAGLPAMLIWLGKQSLAQTDRPADERKAEESSRLDTLIAMLDAQAGVHAG